jgi:hypothetical protein
MLLEWLRDKPQAPADVASREKVVRDLFEGAPIELPEHDAKR